MSIFETLLPTYSLETTGIIGMIILISAVALDFWLSNNTIKGDTVREWLSLKTQEGLKTFIVFKVNWPWFGPFVPFMLGVLLGHFYHPDLSSVLHEENLDWLIAIVQGFIPPPENPNLPEESSKLPETVLLVTRIAVVTIIGFGFSTSAIRINLSNKTLPFIAAFGMIVGAVIWPVGG